MSIVEQKLGLIKWIEEIEDEALIQQLTSIKNNQAENNIQLSAADIRAIKKGKQQVENGQTTAYKQMMKPYEKYLQG